MMVSKQILPIFDGEGDRPKDGGGVMGTKALEPYPSTALQAVPLPKRAWGGYQK
jgi:hypothetical protein